MNKALVIIDIQNDYFPGGKMELVGSDEAAQQAVGLLSAFREKGLPVIHVQHIAVNPGATFFLQDSAGAKIHDSVSPRNGEPVIQKNYPNSFRDTGLLDQLKRLDISRIVFAGMMTHMCIDTTVRAANDLGFNCQLAHDACATRSLSFGEVTVPAQQVHHAFLSALDGSFATVLGTSEIIAGLQ